MRLHDTVSLLYIFESFRLTFCKKTRWPFDPYNMYAEPNGQTFGEYRIAVKSNGKYNFFYPWQIIPLETFRATALINSIRFSKVDTSEKKYLFNKIIRYWLLNDWKKRGQVRGKSWDKNIYGEISIDLLVVKVDLAVTSPHDSSSWEESKILISTKVYYDAENNNVIFD